MKTLIKKLEANKNLVLAERVRAATLRQDLINYYTLKLKPR